MLIWILYRSLTLGNWLLRISYNSSLPGKNGFHFAERAISNPFYEWKLCILFMIPLKFVPNGPIDNKSTLVACSVPSHYLTQCWPGTPTHICSNRGRWIMKDNSSIDSMMTSSNGNIFRVTGHLCWEFTGPRWIPRTKARDAELWCFLWSASQ